MIKRISAWKSRLFFKQILHWLTNCNTSISFKNLILNVINVTQYLSASFALFLNTNLPGNASNVRYKAKHMATILDFLKRCCAEYL